jgi:hypothetical protein
MFTSGALVGAGAMQTAGAATSFQATASAEGVRISGLAGGAPVSDTPFDFGSPVSQATLDSLGTSRAYASAVFPGDLLVSLPGLIAGVSNGQLTPPNYPVIAASDRETKPQSEVSSPGMSMRASSSDTRSAASTVVGAMSTNAAAEVQPDGTIVSKSESIVSGFASDLIKLADLRSTATVILGPDGTVTRESTFSVSGLEVAGVAVAVTRDGLVLGGNTAPLPSSADLAKALEQAGVKLELLAKAETPDGIVGQGLRVTAIRDTGGSVTPIGIDFRFGRAVASVQRTGSGLVGDPLGTVPADNGAPGEPPSPTGASPVAVGLPLPTGGGEFIVGVPAPPSRSPVLPPVVGVPVGDPATSADGSAPATGPAPEVPTEVALQQTPAQLAASRLATRFDTRDLYPLLVALTLMAGAGGFLVAKFGVRTR